MRRLPLLVSLALPLAALAEEPAPEQPPAAAVEVIDAASTSTHSDLERLRQENQRLKRQLRDAQSQQPSRLLNEQQTWYAVGGATAVLAFLLGALSRGSRRRQRREWIN